MWSWSANYLLLIFQLVTFTRMTVVRILFLLSVLTYAPASEAKTPIVIDTDMAIDDWPAMLYLLHHPETEVLAITVTGAGEAHCDPGAQHAVDLVDITPSRGTPVACGPSEPMDGYFEFPKSWRHDADTFYGVPLTRSNRRPVAIGSPELLVTTLRKATQPVRLLILGNATNVGLAMEQAPDIKSKIERIFFMGGSIWHPGNIIVQGFTDHFKNKVAEWNIMIDPVAARIVFRSGVPVTLVPLDGTQQQQVTRQDIRQFTKKAKTPGARFFAKVFEKIKWFVDSGEYYYWDVLTAAVAIHPEFCRMQKLNLDVIVGYSDKTNGTTPPPFSPQRWDGKPRRNFDPYYTGQTILSDEGPSIDVCVESYPALFKPDLIRTLNGWLHTQPEAK